jgi:hypothetical protein
MNLGKCSIVIEKVGERITVKPSWQRSCYVAWYTLASGAGEELVRVERWQPLKLGDSLVMDAERPPVPDT